MQSPLIDNAMMAVTVDQIVIVTMNQINAITINLSQRDVTNLRSQRNAMTTM